MGTMPPAVGEADKLFRNGPGDDRSPKPQRDCEGKLA